MASNTFRSFCWFSCGLGICMKLILLSSSWMFYSKYMFRGRMHIWGFSCPATMCTNSMISAQRSGWTGLTCPSEATGNFYNTGISHWLITSAVIYGPLVSSFLRWAPYPDVLLWSMCEFFVNFTHVLHKLPDSQDASFPAHILISVDVACKSNNFGVFS